MSSTPSVMRRICYAGLSSVLAVAVLAGQSPAGWRFRVDRSASASDPDAPGVIKFVTTGGGFHATNPQAAVFWNPANVVTGGYSVRGRFTLVTPSNHTNYYGLVFGGRGLEGAGQTYLYFLVAQDGTWLLKRRDGDAVTNTLLPKTHSAAIKTPDSTGQSVNMLEVRVTPPALEFLVNGSVVNRWLGAARLVKTDGIYGLRVNHFLEVLVDGLATSPLAPDGGERTKSATVSMTATVSRRLSPTAFQLNDPTTGAGNQLLVVAPELKRPIESGALLTVFGEMVTLDPAEVARKREGSTPDVPADVAATYRGRPMLRAASVLDQQLVDLTQRVPPPMTADEAALSALMKRISPAFTELGQVADRSNADDTVKVAATLGQLFTDVQAFWQGKQRADATAWATEARARSQSIERAARSGQWSLVKSETATIGQQCQACHTAYREPFADGSFRINTVRK